MKNLLAKKIRLNLRYHFLQMSTQSRSRFSKGFSSVGRFPEVWNCLRLCRQPVAIILAYLKVKKLNYPFKITLRSGQHLLLHDWHDLTTAWVVFFGDEYHLLKDDKVIVDLGANIGAFVLLVSRKLPHSKIIAIEPFPENYQRLMRCVEDNGMQDTVAIRPYAVAGSDGSVIMDADPEIPSHSRNVNKSGNPTQSVEVEAVSLETLLKRESIDQLDFLKIDVEGSEYDLILNTSPDLLKKIKRIGLEYHEKGVDEIQTHLAKAGFFISRHPKQGKSGVVEFSRP